MMEKENKNKEIPFVKPARIGNFKIWRNRKAIGKGREKAVIEQINISNLDEGWQIKIPETFEMFAMIRDLYAETTGGVAEQRKSQLSTFFVNMLYASCVANGFFQRGINLCAAIYTNPSLLKEGDSNHERLMKDVHELIAGFLEWRKAYDAKVAENEPTEKDIDNEAKAEEMAEILTKDEDTKDG